MELHAIKSWYDQHHGLVELTDDVLGVVKQVKALGEGRLSVFYNAQSDGYDIVERCLDHTDRLVFSVKELDARVVERLHLADHWGASTPDRSDLKSGHDFADEIEELNEAMMSLKDEASRDKLGDAGERLAWAFDIGVGINASILVPGDKHPTKKSS